MVMIGYSECVKLFKVLKSCVIELSKHCKECDGEGCENCPVDTVKTKLTFTAHYLKRKIEDMDKSLDLLIQEMDDEFWNELNVIVEDIEKMLMCEVGHQ